jgi:hypothetical protein
MSHKPLFCWITIFGVLLLLFLPLMPAAAQEPRPENDANCIACHTHQYYLYDSGKWFCLCDAPMHCVYCHGGRTDTTDKDLAHEGLVLYPTHNHAERCRACHTEDYLERVVTFGAVAGVNPTPQVIATATPAGLAAVSVDAVRIAPTRLAYLEPWQLAGISLIGVALIVLSAFAYRCYRADCMAKLHP